MKVKAIHDLPAPTQERVETYLEAKGWLLSGEGEFVNQYWRSPVTNGDQWYINLTLFRASDFEINMMRVMEIISKSEKRSELDIYNEITGIKSADWLYRFMSIAEFIEHKGRKDDVITGRVLWNIVYDRASQMLADYRKSVPSI